MESPEINYDPQPLVKWSHMKWQYKWCAGHIKRDAAFFLFHSFNAAGLRTEPQLLLLYLEKL